ncbi:hypothetical protein A1Q1_07681 [Trichosporon asahii var. asahii CBS 2479]|uniref:VPS37 C-terminal domain-containing protein n=1 Tax=Trichosporon asahii var. asahii (strain ATCC 90039 / CBS 2479 / JCM 2466 / KCTC 7840 / NBRC 103889/ NCYC 2677 / UAMH 7654) TaxID=1186058 RepID=J5TIK4_TRIAS|nr:hypothetical protein A1Q1_07681 [Trichosporon asahii var. asahii CBS 2479]EJT51086.1 hypothetical protein A1Q1_07681 [Trichosporon asahii var. asahii CBS 2479]
MTTPLLQQFPSLASYPPSFLKDLLSSPQLTEAFLFTLPEVQELSSEVERLGRENEELAQKNLALQDELLALRDATAQSYSHAEALKAHWAEIDKAQQGLYQDDTSEKIASAFIDGGAAGSGTASRVDSPAPGHEDGTSSLDEFINEFKAARKTYHKRNIWAERWSRGEVAWRDD